MSYLVYCLFPSGGHRGPHTLPGVGGQPVFLIENNGLAAAVSRISSSDLTPDTRRVLAYGKVVESFHRRRTVIPMRHGCLFEEKSNVVRFLGERRQEYEALLRKLEGCVEMGVRVLPEEAKGRDTNADISPSCPSYHPADASNTGRAYLNARKAHYAQQERFTKENVAVIERCRTAFAGLFVECKAEFPPLRPAFSRLLVPLLSLYFLVRRTCLGRFRNAFRQFSSYESARLLLSGPWPPYNFVEPAPAGEMGTVRPKAPDKRLDGEGKVVFP